MKARCRFLNAMFSKPNFLEVNAWGVSKYAAIVQLEKIIKCESKNFIAMGDGDNDVEMIQNCGYGVAMANGSSLAKNAAKKIALSHDQDGAAWFLSEYFFKQNDI
jgi:hydroxymethylpyrimidine pyrophosphatase-like HAD family hydrolase